MILHPAVLALVLGSFLIGAMVLYASFFGFQIIRRWDMNSGTEGQLDLERKTYLISTLLSYLLVFQVGSLFLYIFTADSLHRLFVGAMCAAGTLNVNSYGYPAFLLKIFNCILAGLWLIINYTDNQAYDYPLIKKKYGLLLILTPLLILETVIQSLYFTGLKGDVITSCCGTLFSTDRETVSSEIAALPVRASMIGFYLTLGLLLVTGVVFRIWGKLGTIFSLTAVVFFFISCMAFISFIALYFYELPTHHCPFCVLQREYGYIGYLIYGTLLTGVVSGLGVGALMPFKDIKSLSRSLLPVQKRLALVCLLSYLVFAGVSIGRQISTDFTLGVW